MSSRERTRRERYNSVPTAKLVSLPWKKKAHQQHRPMSAHFSSFMSLVYNMITYHPKFRKWPEGLVVGYWGQEWLMPVKSQPPGRGPALGHSVQVQVCSTTGYWKNQFSLDPQSNPMVGQTQDLSQPGDLTASSTNIRRKILVKNKRVLLELIGSVEFLLLLLFNYCVYSLKATSNFLENKDSNNKIRVQRYKACVMPREV